MHIVVLVKQVPNTTQVKIDPVTNNLVREGVPSIVNPYDLYAIEEALRLREKHGGRVTALSMGPRQALEVVKYALAMGADQGVLLSDRAFAGADTLATSYTLAAGLACLEPADLVLAGKQAADGDTAQVPAELAGHLGLGCLTYVSRILSLEAGKATVIRAMDFAEVKAEVALPAVLTLNKGINEPRLPRLRDMVRAAGQPVRILQAADMTLDESRISLAGSPTQVMKVFSPERKKSGFLAAGGPAQQAATVVKALQERGMI